MVEVRFGTYNTFNLFEKDTPDERERYTRVVEAIQALNVDVLAVQEIIAPDVDLAGWRLKTLADDAGMACEYTPGKAAIAAGRQRFHVALLWRHELQVVPDTFRVYGAADFWHAAAKITFDFDGQQVQHGSHHATPFGKGMRADQMERLVAAFTRPEDRPPGLVGADWNCVGADRVDGTVRFYDPDPYSDQPWHDDLIYQTNWSYDQDGRRHHEADRRPGEVLYAGGLQDAAAVLGAPWEPTVGHWPDPYGERRIDGVRVTWEVVTALRSIEVARNEVTLSASDHLPVVVAYETTKIG